MNTSSASLRRRLVSDLEKSRYIRSEPVKRAFLAVPRELFVPEIAKDQGLDAIYRNVALPTKKDARGIPISSSSEPAIMAAMLEELRLVTGMKVLEVGAGTGYNAALLKTMVGDRGRVVTVDLEPELAAKARVALRSGGYPVTVKSGDGARGWKEGAPYDRIIVTASLPSVPRAWLSQLVEGGLVELPLRLTNRCFSPQAVVTLRRKGSRLESVSINRGGFMGMRAKSGDPAPGPDATVYIGFMSGGKGKSFGSVSGNNIERLSDKRRRLLASLISTEPRVRQLPSGLRRYEFEVFLALATREELLVSFHRPRASQNALIGVDGRSFAVLAGSTTRFTRIESAGDRKAEIALASVFAEWQKLGSPRLSDLFVTVTYGNERSRAWRTFRQARCVISYRWDHSPRR